MTVLLEYLELNIGYAMLIHCVCTQTIYLDKWYWFAYTKYDSTIYSKPHLSNPHSNKLKMTVLLEYFEYKCMFY